MKIKLFIIIGLVSMLLLGASCTRSQDFDNQVGSIVQPYRFSIAGWGFKTLLSDVKEPSKGNNVEDESGTVTEYFSLAQRIRSLKSEVEVNTSNGQGASSSADELKSMLLPGVFAALIVIKYPDDSESQPLWFSALLTQCIDKTMRPFPQISPVAELQLLRIAQEALTNVRRHALATEIEVKLESGKEAVEMLIKDNGQGFTLSKLEESPPGYHGLNIIKERAEGLGGSLSIFTAPGEGTALMVSLPLEKVRL